MVTDISMSGTGLPNCNIVTVGEVRFLFSYNTVVGIHDGSGWVVSENVWSKTTGKHLNWTGVAFKDRMPYEEFRARLTEVLEGKV